MSSDPSAPRKPLPPVNPTADEHIPKRGAAARRPEWLRTKVDVNETFTEVRGLLSGLALTTVCSEARCPNIWECWGKHRTATLMILGDTCTRACRYCSVNSGRPAPPDPEEPHKVAEAVARLELRHAVITSVDRDDLPDFGAGHFAATIHAIRARHTSRSLAPPKIEVLIPDFAGDGAALRRVLDAGPEVLGHNVETVPRLYPTLRSRGDYPRTLEVLRQADAYRREHQPSMLTKSGLMLGLGESLDEVRDVMRDLREVNCDVLTIGQYLNPTTDHAPIARFYTPEEFDGLAAEARALGFSHCESGPLVRSSYHAHAYGFADEG